MKNKVLKRLSLRRPSFNERGDTIVEVMIVLAVLGMAIGISYATANRSLLNARQAQENSQAAELVQSQIEQLRTLTTSNCTTAPIDRDHCIYSASPYGGSNTPFCLVGGQIKDAKTNSGCLNAGENGRYSLTITRDDTIITPDDKRDTFTVTAKWDDVLGEGVDTVTLIYRVHKPVDVANIPPPVVGPPPEGGPPPVGGSPSVTAISPPSVSREPNNKWTNFSVSIAIGGGTPGGIIWIEAGGGNSAYPAYAKQFTFDASGNASGTMSGRCEGPSDTTTPWYLYITGPKQYTNANGSWKNTNVQVCP